MYFTEQLHFHGLVGGLYHVALLKLFLQLLEVSREAQLLDQDGDFTLLSDEASAAAHRLYQFGVGSNLEGDNYVSSILKAKVYTSEALSASDHDRGLGCLP